MTTKMTDAELMERLCALAAEQSGVDASMVSAESDLFRDLNFDSLDAVEYMMKLEDEFDISIDDAHAEGVRTPRQAFELLIPRLKGKEK